MYSIFVIISAVTNVGITVRTHEINGITNQSDADRLATLLADKSSPVFSIFAVVFKK